MKIEFRTHDLGVKGLDPAIAKAKSCGIDGVQLVAYKFMNEIKYAPGQLNKENSRRIGSALRANGIDVGLIGAYFNPVHSNPQKVENGIAVFKEYLTYCSNLGCKIVGSETGSFNDDKWTYNPLNRTEEALARVTATFKDLAEFAGEKGVNIGMEGAAGHVCYDVKTLKRAIDGINLPNVKVIFDLYNYLDESNHERYLDILQEGLETFEGKICVFHMKDYVFDEAENKVKQVPPGKGLFNYRTILRLVKRYERNARLVLEGTTGENIIPCSQYLRELWKDV